MTCDAAVYDGHQETDSDGSWLVDEADVPSESPSVAVDEHLASELEAEVAASRLVEVEVVAEIESERLAEPDAASLGLMSLALAAVVPAGILPSLH